MTVLRQVLQTFEQANRPLSLAQMAQQLNLEPAMLEAMIGYWVRKGRVRETAAPACGSCGLRQGCAPLISLPRRYELASAESSNTPSNDAPDQPPCGCARCG